MIVNEATEKFYSLLSEEPLVGISTVSQNMNDRRRLYEPAGYPQFVPFGFSYNVVTDVIDDQVTFQMATGAKYFAQPQVLPVAIGKFDHKAIRPFLQKKNGQPVDAHWNVLMEHELVHLTDPAVLAGVGFIDHIGAGDLAETLDEIDKSELFSRQVKDEYFSHDYDKIDGSLSMAAKKIGPILMETTSPAKREFLTKMTLGGVTLGRKWARRDFKRLRRARSDDHREAIIYDAQARGAKLSKFIIESAYMHGRVKGVFFEAPVRKLNIAALV